MAVGRIVGIVGAVALLGGGGGYFAGGSTRAESEFTVERGQQTVITWLASAPDDAPVAEGAAINGEVTRDENVVSAPVLFTDGRGGRVVYTVTPAENPQHSRVAVELVRDSGWNPITRFQALTGGGDAPAYAQAAVATAQTSLGALQADIEPVAYSIETLTPRPFIYVQNCSPSDDVTITSVLRRALNGARSEMTDLRLTAAGEPMAVEPSVEENQYCYQIGYPYSGATQEVTTYTRLGQTPGGQAIRIAFTGAEADVVPQVYNRIDALLAAARLDPTPGNTAEAQADDWPTMEIYHDDPTQVGGSRNRTIYYIVPEGADLERLTALVPPTAPAQAPAAPAAPAGEQPAAPAPAPAQ